MARLKPMGSHINVRHAASPARPPCRRCWWRGRSPGSSGGVKRKSRYNLSARSPQSSSYAHGLADTGRPCTGPGGDLLRHCNTLAVLQKALPSPLYSMNTAHLVCGAERRAGWEKDPGHSGGPGPKAVAYQRVLFFARADSGSLQSVLAGGQQYRRPDQEAQLRALGMVRMISSVAGLNSQLSLRGKRPHERR